MTSLGGVTKNAFRRGIDGFDNAAVIDRDDSVDRGLDNAAQSGRGIAQLAFKLQAGDGGGENVVDRFEKMNVIGAEDARRFGIDVEHAKGSGPAGNDDRHAARDAAVAQKFRQAQSLRTATSLMMIG